MSTKLELGDPRYALDVRVGEGGMAVVYRAKDLRLKKDVAIKVPRQEGVDQEQILARFRRELQSLVKLTHPHICSIVDAGEYNGLPFIVMQYLAGGTLRDSQKLGPDGKRIPIPAKTVATWIGMIAAALDFIHEKGYVHRDVKPSNILFDAHGNAYLSDFGVIGVSGTAQGEFSRGLTSEGVVTGTPGYMAPEMIAGKPYDGRADQYSLAIVVYEMLTGRNPFQGLDSHAVHRLQQKESVLPLHELLSTLPPELSQVMRRAMSFYPTQRFPTCGAFVRELMRVIEAAQKPHDPTALETRKGDSNAETPLASQGINKTPISNDGLFVGRRRNVFRGLVLIATLLVAVLGGGYYFLLKDRNHEPDKPNNPHGKKDDKPNNDPPQRPIPLVVVIHGVDNDLLDEAEAGVKLGLNEEGLINGLQYIWEARRAHGNEEKLQKIISEVKALRPDAIVTVTTPALIATAKEIRDIPIVFTVASNPRILNGVYVDGRRPDNLVGVHDDPPVDKLIDLALSQEPSLKTVGILWNSKEPNSEISAKKLRIVCKERGLNYEEQKVSGPEDLDSATAALCRKNVQIIVISADNLTTTGLPLIVNRATPLKVPIYSTEPSMVHRGVKAAIGDDYKEWGKQSGRLLAKVLKGMPPARLDLEPTRIQRTVFADKKGP